MVKDAGRTRAILLSSVILAVLAGVAVTLALRASSGPRQAPPDLPGSWKLIFDSEFNGGALDRSVWNAHDGWRNQNGVTDHERNVAVRNGHAILTLASPDSGAEISTWSFGLAVGDYVEARIEFPGSGSTIYNWPAWWLSGPDWPAGGENDVAEGFGNLTVNYHSPDLTHLTGPVPGNWAGAFHTYGIYRGRGVARVYWDGRLVRSYRTADDGRPETLLLTLGAANTIRTGPAGAMVVDWVRAWSPG